MLGKSFIFLSFIFSISALAYAPKIILGEVVKKGDPGTQNLCTLGTYGMTCYMFWKDAYQYCLNHGSVLPSIFEYAVYAQQNGAPGVVDANFSRTKELIESYDRIGESHFFYYARPGLKDKTIQRGHTGWTWSSSLSSLNQEYAFRFDDSTFSIDTIKWKNNEYQWLAVRCKLGVTQ